MNMLKNSLQMVFGDGNDLVFRKFNILFYTKILCITVDC